MLSRAFSLLDFIYPSSSWFTFALSSLWTFVCLTLTLNGLLFLTAVSLTSPVHCSVSMRSQFWLDISLITLTFIYISYFLFVCLILSKLPGFVARSVYLFIHLLLILSFASSYFFFPSSSSSPPSPTPPPLSLSLARPLATIFLNCFSVGSFAVVVVVAAVVVAHAADSKLTMLVFHTHRLMYSL